MAQHTVILALALVACTSCARNPITPGSGGSRSGLPGGAVIYDNSQRILLAGRELDLRLRGALSSKTATVNQRFEATTADDLLNGPRVIVPAGSVVHGVVRVVEKADGLGRQGALTLSFTELVTNGRSIAIDGHTVQLFEGGALPQERDPSAVEPALIGGTLADLDEDLTTSVTAADGSIVATQPGADAELATGTIVRIRMSANVAIR